MKNGQNITVNQKFRKPSKKGPKSYINLKIQKAK